MCWLCCALLVIATAYPRPAPAQDTAPQVLAATSPLPSFDELEAAGAIVGEIRIQSRDIFDLDDPKENGLLYRLANALHIRTRPEVIARGVLFKSGDPVSSRLIEETERLFRANRYLYDIHIAPLAYHDGIVDIEISVRDTWTLNPGLTFSRQGGKNTSGVLVAEQNLFGTGTAVTYQRTSTPDRTFQEYVVAQEHAFDGWTALRYAHAISSDGVRRSASVERPFYSADVRWAAGVTDSDDERIDTVYRDGVASGQYRAHENISQFYVGWSPGLAAGWTHRYSAGWLDQGERYAPAAGPTVPALPEDQRLVGPLLRYEVVEEKITKLKNRDQIGRPEYFSLGLNVRVQLATASAAFGASHNVRLYDLALADGYTPAPGTMWVATAAARGRHDSTGFTRQHAEAEISYYRSRDDRRVGFAALRVEAVKNPLPAELPQLGGDTGLRGYPLRQQSGEKLALLTLEERVFTDWYVFRLFRIGAAAFFDIGRAWGGESPDAPPKPWLSDAGVGLRIANSRIAFSNVLHADLAFPIGAGADVKKVQFLVKTRVSF